MDETAGAQEWLRAKLFMRRPWLGNLPASPPLPPDCVMRAYRPADQATLAMLLTRAFDEPWDEARVRQDLTEAPDVEAVYVAAEGGRLIATASARIMPEVYPGSGYLHWVAVAPEARGKRLGTALSLRVLHHFRGAGLRDAVLETQNFRVAAVVTYLRLGFVPESRDDGEQRRWATLLPILMR